MTDNDAWMKRGSERQEFLNRVKSNIMGKEHVSGNRLISQLALCRALAVKFAALEGRVITESIITPEAYYLKDTIVPSVEKFARTPEEASALLADLFMWVCESIQQHMKSPLQTQEIDAPEKVFDLTEG